MSLSSGTTPNANTGDWIMDFMTSLKNNFQQGLELFLTQAGRQIGESTAGSIKAHNSIVFTSTASPWKLSWLVPADFFIVGFLGFAGFAVSTNPSYANYAAIVNQVGFVNDVLLMCPVTSGALTQMGDVQVPVFKDQTLTFYGNVANAVQLFLQPQSTG